MRNVTNLHGALAFVNWQLFGSPTDSKVLGAGGSLGSLCPPTPTEACRAEQGAQHHSQGLGRSPKRDASNDHQFQDCATFKQSSEVGSGFWLQMHLPKRCYCKFIFNLDVCSLNAKEGNCFVFYLLSHFNEYQCTGNLKFFLIFCEHVFTDEPLGSSNFDEGDQHITEQLSLHCSSNGCRPIVPLVSSFLAFLQRPLV